MDRIISVTKTILLLFLYSLLAGLHVLTNANLEEITSLAREPPYNVCSNSNNSYAVDIPFQNNLRSLFSSISSNASVTKFSRSSSENGSGRLYGLHMCLNYNSTTLTDCKTCIDTASDDINRLCPSKKEAVVWEDSCLLRYSDDNFFGKLDVSGKIPRANFKNVSEPENYKSVVNTILSSLIKRAVSDPANSLSATDDTPFTNADTVYALVQCTRDLSPDVCNSCLQDAKSEILSCCYFSRGARVYSRSCFLRYELYDFINGANESPASSGKQVKGKGSQRKTWMIMIATILVTLLLVALLAFAVYCLTKMKRTQKGKSEVTRQVQLHKVGDSNNTEFYHGHIQGRENLEAQEFHIDLKTIHLATDNFSDSNMLGQGGFGPVYKGVLSDGKEVAIKRLSSYSEQGNEEFTNEVLLIVKLQHKNLVRLLGFCVEAEEKLLVYEYMPNSSLDLILFDTRKREQLDWSKRIHIINGIAKGILYLHADSRLRIIHRDLKASNILLDSDMNPKISDFGMARIFAGSEGETSTIKIVGTYGYMAPEYAMEGLYSIKSDVFSFGVLLLEILTGQRNSGFHYTKNATSLLAYAWQLWNEGNALELMDPLLTETCGPEEFLRCIHIGLLCVQEDAFDRPTMSSVVIMLKGETVTLHQPGKPPFLLGRVTQHHEINDCFSVNGLTVSDVLPR